MSQAARPWPPSGDRGPELRIGDSDRAAAAEELAEHYAVGRLSTEEHSERLDRIWAARTRSELAPVFADLPGSSYRVPTTYPTVGSGAVGQEGSRSGPRAGQSGWPHQWPHQGQHQTWGYGGGAWSGPRPAAAASGWRRAWHGLPVMLRILLILVVGAVVLSQLPLILFGLIVFLVIRHGHRTRHPSRPYPSRPGPFGPEDLRPGRSRG